jgi:uncharacterized protein (TIGR00369 family)
MAEAKTGPFWDMMAGRLPPPPAAKLLGWELLSLDAETGEIAVSFQGKVDFTNPVGTIQGGMLTAMLDDTMGPAATAFLGGHEFAQTLELKTSFLRAAKPGRLIGRARVVQKGRDILFLEGSLEDEAGQLIAKASATARRIAFAPR